MEFKDFLHPRAEEEIEQTPERVLKALLLKSLNDFEPEDRPYIQDYVVGGWLTPDEAKATHDKVKEWWKKQFGVNYENTAHRRRILHSLIDTTKTDLQNKYLENIRFRVSEEENKKLKDAFIKEFPDQIQGIELLFGLQRALVTQSNLDKAKKDKDATLEEKRADIIWVTEYFFTLTNFIHSNKSDKEFLKLFWQMLEEVAVSADLGKDFYSMKVGVLSHIACHQIAEKIGLRPQTSKPLEDAFYGIDEFGRRGEVLQYKTKENLSMMRGEVDLDQKKKSFGVFVHLNGLQYYNDFREKMKRRCTSEGKKKQVYYFIDVPRDGYDAITGEVHKDVLQQVTADDVRDVESVLGEEILKKEDILRNEIVRGTEEYYRSNGSTFNEVTMPYLLNDEEYKILMRQCVLHRLGSVSMEHKAIVYPFVFNGEEKIGLGNALKEFWRNMRDTFVPSFDNKEAVGDYLFRRFLRDVDYGWKKRDMAGSTGVSTGK